MKIIEEFKEFAVKGNAVDMAVGIVIGAAFGTVVKSLVDDVVMPPFGKLLGGADFSNLFINLSDGSYDSLAAAQQAGATTINYGLFINSVIAFLIVSWALFLVVKAMNKLNREDPITEPINKDCPECLSTVKVDAKRCPHCTSKI